MLVGNKADLQNERVITKEQAEQLANELKCPYYETSTKENVNVHMLFEEMVALIHPQDQNTPKHKSKACLLL